MKPGSAPNTSRTSSASAGRACAPSALASLFSLRRSIAAHGHEHGSAAVDEHRERLDESARRHAEHSRDRLDRRRAGRLDRPGLGQRLGKAVHRPRRGRGDLHVGRVAGVGEGDLVLTGRAGRHVLVGAEAPHHPHVRLHPIPLEARAVEDAVVGLDVQLVGAIEAVRVAVEAVGVLHDELARSQHPGARPRLVALFGLEVIEDLGQVAVGANLARHVEGHVLLVCHRQHEIGAAPVLQPEDLVDVVAARSLPELGGLEHRHQQLGRSDRVELLADDLLRLAMGAPAGGEPGPHARADLARQPGAHEQPVGRRLGVGRRLPQSWEEIAGKPRHSGRV